MTSLPANYQSMSGEQKLQLLWQRISASPYRPGQLPVRVPGNLARRKLFSVGYNRKSFEHVGDEMPPGRTKLVHRFGTVALVDLIVEASDESGGEPNDRSQSYTGVFATGGSAILRISDTVGTTGFIPTLAFKFPVDGRPSINLFANQAQRGPAWDYDVFARYYSNALPAPTRLDEKAVAWSFQRTANALRGARLYSGYLPLHQPAGARLDGTRVAEPVVPDRVEFHPTGDLSLTVPKTSDWRLALTTIEPGATLFETRIAPDIHSPATSFGRVVLKRAFVASAYGDDTLFFQHDIGPRRT